MVERNTVRTYCKLATVSNGAYVDVDFRDTAGNRITCNWFSVDCSAAPVKDVAYYIVTPSGSNDAKISGGKIANSLYAGFASAVDVIANASSGPTYTDDGLGNITVTWLLQNTASGIGGVIGIPGRDPVEMNWQKQRKLSISSEALVEGDIQAQRTGVPIGVRIWNLTNSHPHALFTIAYGNTKHANRLKDSDDIFWPPGD